MIIDGTTAQDTFWQAHFFAVTPVLLVLLRIHTGISEFE